VGKAIKNLKWRRSDVVLITKIFFGTATSKEPNARGLSRKHIIEGTNDSLERAGLTYWDAVFGASVSERGGGVAAAAIAAAAEPPPLLPLPLRAPSSGTLG